MKISISPQYEHLRGDILKVVTGDYIASKVYCHKRNVVEKVCMQGKDYKKKIRRHCIICKKKIKSLNQKQKGLS